jgi:hypothetical protein
MIDRTTAGTLNIGSEDLAKWDCLGTFSGPCGSASATRVNRLVTPGGN